MALPEDHLEQRQQIEVGASKINFIQHVADILSLDSSSSSCELCAPGRAAANGAGARHRQRSMETICHR
jgi:hypothetical protein